MINKYVAIGLGVLIALEPLAAVAQTVQLAQAAPAATEAMPAATHGTRGCTDGTPGARGARRHAEQGLRPPSTQPGSRRGAQELISSSSRLGGRERRWGPIFAAPTSDVVEFPPD